MLQCVDMGVLFLLLAAAAFAQQHNYTQGDIDEGARQYRTNCIGCHGPEGNLVTGIELGRNRFRRVSTDEEIVDVIINGVKGTGMPPNNISPPRAYTIVAYLRSMSTATAAKSIAAARGDIARGKALFEGKGACQSCHRVRGEGARTGPDLSETGLSLRAIEIETSILDPDASFSTSNQPFRLVKKDGAVVTGLLLNYDMFSFQILDAKGALASIPKSQVKESGFVAKSPMPSYRGKFDAQELADVIAYVESLKGAN